MGVSATTTRQPRNHNEKVAAMFAEMEKQTPHNAFLQNTDKEHPNYHPPVEGLFQPAKSLNFKKAAPAPAATVETFTDADHDAKPEQLADPLSLALDALRCGVFADLDDLTKTEYAGEVVASYRWEELTIPQKALISSVLSPMERDRSNPKRATVQSAHSMFRKVTEKKPPMPETYAVAWAENANVITCRCEAGCRNHDCYHAEQFRNEYGDDIRRVYSKEPRLMSEACSMDRSMAWLETNDVRKIAEDF